MEAETLKLRRAIVRWQSVRGNLIEPGLAYLRVTNFQEHTGEMLASTIERLWRENAGPMQGVVLDLRDNPGGLLTAAVAVCAAFLPANAPVVSAEGAGHASKMRLHASKADYLRGEATDYLAHLPAELKTLPLVVLVNKHSASSSEIVAGALQDHRRASIVGTRTFGKGSIQRLYLQQDGSGLKITTSYYYTPSGRKVQGNGVAPDIVVEREPAAAKSDGLQTVSVNGQVAQAEASSATQACVPPPQAAGDADTAKEPDCQLSEAVRLLRVRTGVSQG
jgi:carboxyl-terminal processing protease